MRPAFGSSTPRSLRNYLQGHYAEGVACLMLLLKGYRLTARRCRTPVGEIDIIAQKRDVLVLVEVKKRLTLSLAAAAILPQQQQRLIRAARFLVAGKPKLRHYQVRFDAVLVNRWGWPRHMINAWME